MADLTSVNKQDSLKYKPEPYWQKLAGGQYLGYRPAKKGKGGTWHARLYDSEGRKQLRRPLGAFEGLPSAERFAAASQEAREWFNHMAGGGNHEIVTVADACRVYAADHPEAAPRFARYVYKDPVAGVKLHKLTEQQVRGWRRRLEQLPALVSRRKNSPEVTRPRAAATVNRDMVPFRAALNMALGTGDVRTARAWSKALEPLESHGRRNLYLDREQRRSLVEQLSGDARQFVVGLCSLPFRPGALADLSVGNFDVRRKELLVQFDKAKPGRKLLLPQDAVMLLQSAGGGRPDNAPLFERANGKAWGKDSWKKPIKAAARAAGLPAGTTAYTLRHSTITDLVQSGLNLLAVAQLSGTSVSMIEKHYGHLQREQAADALAGLTL